MATDKELWKAAGKRLATARLNAGYASQKAFAAAVNLAEPTIAKYEQGAREIPISLLYWLSDQHGVDINWVITGLGDAPVAASESVLSPRTERLVGALEPLIQLIERVYEEMGVTLPGNQKAKVLTRWYENLLARIGENDDLQSVTKSLQWVEDGIRAELRNKAENLLSSKRTAS